MSFWYDFYLILLISYGTSFFVRWPHNFFQSAIDINIDVDVGKDLYMNVDGNVNVDMDTDIYLDMDVHSPKGIADFRVIPGSV